MSGQTASPAFRHVLCVYPYRREISNSAFFPPIGLEIIAGVVRPHARSIDVVDMRFESGRTRDFLREDTDLVCFSVNWNVDREFLCEEIRSVPPNVLTVLGGRHATESPDRWLADFPNVDAVVRGDGEEVMEDLCRGVPMEQITGLSFRRDGRIVHNPNRAPGPLRDEAIPARDLRRRTYEARIRGAGTGLLVDLVSSSRGCPFNCTFCSFSRNPWGVKRGWSARSAASVVDEIASTEAQLVGFTDDLFTWDMDRVSEICERLVARKIRKRYLVTARLEIAKRPDVLRKMERAGFLALGLGIESAHDRTLKSMRKGFDTAQIREYCAVLRRTRMMLHGYFMIGNIGESVEDMRRTVPFAREIGLDTIGLSTLRSSPYSGLDELVAASPGYHIDSEGKIYSDACSGRALARLRRRLLAQFYTPLQFVRIFRKAVRNDVAFLLPAVLPRLLPIVSAMVSHSRRRSKRRAQQRRDALNRRDAETRRKAER